MAVSKDNQRILITIPNEIKSKLEIKAKAENRSVSNYVCNLIIKDLERSNAVSAATPLIIHGGVAASRTRFAAGRRMPRKSAVKKKD